MSSTATEHEQHEPGSRLHFSPRLQLDFKTFSDLRILLSNKPSTATLHSRFACYLALYLPEVAALIDEDDFGIIHLEIATLAKATTEAIKRNDWLTVRKHFAFVMDLLNSVGAELQDAIHVSFAKYLSQYETDISTPEVKEQLSLHLQALLEKVEAILLKSQPDSAT